MSPKDRLGPGVKITKTDLITRSIDEEKGDQSGYSGGGEDKGEEVERRVLERWVDKPGL